jgi:Amt family ammonium transporter
VDASIGAQLMGVFATLLYGGVVSFAILYVVDKVIGLRVSEEQEQQGLDIAEHGEQVL